MAVVLFTLPLLGDITLGTAIGVVAGVAQFLLARGPKPETVKAMTSAWGDTIPIVYNTWRVPGKVIQAGELMEVDVKVGPGKKTQDYSLTFAVGICEGTIRAIAGNSGVQLGRIWADNQVIYDPRPNALPPTWQANHLYGAGDIVQATGVTDWIFTATVNGESGPTEPAWNFVSDGATRDDEVVWLATKYRPRNKVGKQYNFYFTFYPGSEDQLPDSSLEELVGVGSQPAYRGLAYCVFYSFDLTRYGNRIPNFEFEIFPAPLNPFVEGGILYGSAFGGDAVSPPFLTAAGGTLFNMPRDGNQFANIKTLAVTHVDTTRSTADAVANGCPAPYLPSAGWQATFPIAGPYFGQMGICILGSLLYWTVLLYEINDDGTYTCLGVKSFQVPTNPFFSSFLTAGIRPDTQEVWVAFTDLDVLAVSAAVLSTIVGMTGAWFAYNNINRVMTPDIGGGNLAGPFAAVPGGGVGFNVSFVGNYLWVTLNKANMDFIASHHSGDPYYNDYYASLQPANPDGAMIKVVSVSDGTGGLHAVSVGLENFDYGWPFADEGLNSIGSPGNTTNTSLSLDCWGIPVQQQEVDGTVDAVWFARPYSDKPNELGVAQFANGALAEQIDGAPFTNSFAGHPNAPMVNMASDGYIYGAFQSSSIYYCRLGNFASSALTLADVCHDASLRVGLTDAQMNYGGLVPVVPLGCALLQRDTARSFIENLQPAFFFDLTDIGAQVVGTLRSNDFVVQIIPEADLGAVPADAQTRQNTIVDKINSTRNDDLEIPEDLSIGYYDNQHDYQQGSQQARRSKVTQYSSGKNTVNVPIVMDPYEANNAATRGLFLLWVERINRKFILPIEYLARTAVDVVKIQRDGREYVVRLTKVTLKANFTIECESVSEDLGTYLVNGVFPITSTASGSFTSQTINPPTTPVLVVADTATLRPDDLTLPGTYVAAANSAGGQYDTVTVQESPDNSVFTSVASLPNEAAIGTAAVALGAPAHCASWDAVNTLTVSLLFGTLANADKWALTDDITTNLALIGNEIIQFATATLNMDGTYTLSGLRRGRLGTEQFCNTHVADETFLMLTAAVMGNVTYSASDINATRYWQALNDAPVNAASPVQTLTMFTRRLLPYAPTYIRGARDTPGNLTITGLRRTRWHGQPLWSPAETDTPPIVEIDIIKMGSVVRTLTSTLSANGSGITAVPSPGPFTAYYAELDQVIDFGSAQASVSLKAYSRNATIGRGYPGVRAV